MKCRAIDQWSNSFASFKQFCWLYQDCKHEGLQRVEVKCCCLQTRKTQCNQKIVEHTYSICIKQTVHLPRQPLQRLLWSLKGLKWSHNLLTNCARKSIKALKKVRPFRVNSQEVVMAPSPIFLKFYSNCHYPIWWTSTKFEWNLSRNSIIIKVFSWGE